MSTFAGTFISADRKNDISRSALTNRPASTYIHRTKVRVGDCKMEDGEDEENGEKRMRLKIQKRLDYRKGRQMKNGDR